MTKIPAVSHHHHEGYARTRTRRPGGQIYRVSLTEDLGKANKTEGSRARLRRMEKEEVWWKIDFPLWFNYKDIFFQAFIRSLAISPHWPYYVHKPWKMNNIYAAGCIWQWYAFHSRTRRMAGCHPNHPPPFYVWAPDKSRLKEWVCRVKFETPTLWSWFKIREIRREMEAICILSNLARPTHMINRRDVNQKWLSIWRGGEKHCQLVTTWLVCTGQEWSLFEYASPHDHFFCCSFFTITSSAERSWLIIGIASEPLAPGTDGSFPEPQN